MSHDNSSNSFINKHIVWVKGIGRIKDVLPNSSWIPHPSESERLACLPGTNLGMSVAVGSSQLAVHNLFCSPVFNTC